MKNVIIIDETDFKKLLLAINNIESEICISKNPIDEHDSQKETLMHIENHLRDIQLIINK